MTGAGGRGEGSAPLLTGYDVLLLDLDGVVYRGPDAVPHAVESLLAARDRWGVRLGYVTNNASRPPESVSEHLTSLGLSAAASDVVTSAQAGARLVADVVPPGSAVLAVGGPGLVAALAEVGLRAVMSADQTPAAVLQGFDPTLGWAQLAEGAYAVSTGVPWVATNTDMSIPTARGTAPGNGTLVAAVAAATGRAPVVAGKPEEPLMRESVRRLAATAPLVVGDRLDTDIEGAVRVGLPSVLVLTGVTDAAALLDAPPTRRPTFVVDDLRALLLPYPVVDHLAGEWRCGGWRVRVEGRSLVVAGRGDRPIDGLRAAAAAWWAAADGRDPRDRRAGDRGHDPAAAVAVLAGR